MPSTISNCRTDRRYAFALCVLVLGLSLPCRRAYSQSADLQLPCGLRTSDLRTALVDPSSPASLTSSSVTGTDSSSRFDFAATAAFSNTAQALDPPEAMSAGDKAASLSPSQLECRAQYWGQPPKRLRSWLGLPTDTRMIGAKALAVSVEIMEP